MQDLLVGVASYCRHNCGAMGKVSLDRLCILLQGVTACRCRAMETWYCIKRPGQGQQLSGIVVCKPALAYLERSCRMMEILCETTETEATFRRRGIPGLCITSANTRPTRCESRMMAGSKFFDSIFLTHAFCSPRCVFISLSSPDSCTMHMSGSKYTTAEAGARWRWVMDVTAPHLMTGYTRF